jgi:transcriptional regulator with PAS, ATPase and Fis domain
MKRTNIKLSSEIKNLFVQYHWPNNVRELKHTIESSIIRCDYDTIFWEHLPDNFGQSFEEENLLNQIPEDFQKFLLDLCKSQSENLSLNHNRVSNHSANMDEQEKALISLIIDRDNPIISRRDYGSFKNVSKASANRFIKKMVESGVLLQKGRGRGTYYTISPKRFLELAKKYGFSR